MPRWRSPGRPSRPCGWGTRRGFPEGFLGSLLFAMATRVICGHGGIALVADDFVWARFRVLQAATVLLLGAAVWPAHASVLLAASALAWTGVWVAWATRHLPVLLRPRRDGRPG